MLRWLALAAFMLAAGVIDAHAARTVLADFLKRPSLNPDEPPMSVLALEACMRRAQELDRTGTAIDYEIAAIDREAAEALLLQRQLNTDLPFVGGFDEAALQEFQRRAARHEELSKKFQVEFPLYQQNQKAYDDAIEEFGRICARPFQQDDLQAVKRKLDLN